MPRTLRASRGGICYHVLNRGNGGGRVYHHDEDYQAFVELMAAASDRLPMRVLAYCLMPNHFHLVLWPREDGDLSRWMQWLMTSHVRRHHRRHDSHGHLWQGRFKAFPTQSDEHLLTVLRYVERNPLRARLVARAEDWRWSSLRWWRSRRRPAFLVEGPVRRPRGWRSQVGDGSSDAELESLRQCVNRGAPFGSRRWVKSTAKRLHLESALRPRGRPRKEE